MKKFSFNLKALLELREWEEQVARQAFSQSIQAVSILKDKASRVEQEKEAICQEWDKTHPGSFSRNDRLALNAAISNASRVSEESKNALEVAEKKREKALTEMKLAVRKKKVVANLKQRRLEEHQAEALRQETIEIEDIYNARSIERRGI